MRETVEEYGLTDEQKRTAKKLLRKFGGSSSPAPFTWGRAEVNEEVGKVVAMPPQAAGCSFTSFPVGDSRRLARELRKLLGQPVIVTGGGGGGLRWCFLQAVRSTSAYRGTRDAQGNWSYDKTKPKVGSVSVSLQAFPGEKDSLFRDGWFRPTLGSWTINAIHGYGADRVNCPAEWSEPESGMEYRQLPAVAQGAAAAILVNGRDDG